MKKNIWIYILVGVFLQPHIFNNLHFALVSHEHRWEFEISKEKSFHAQDKFHNCEQYLFKVPPVTEVNLFQERIILVDFNFREIFPKEEKILIQKINNHHHKRGPPKLI
ncbi:hypothetical protein [Moheibacter sediminis]|uniref:hypothetical protein n=1 Tax=Moheibacter sediminis TaxID=1434700 RepID=UPI00117F4AC8|nr:hypothetical protein [Moheibacter sediminis]